MSTISSTSHPDSAFAADRSGLERAIDLLIDPGTPSWTLPATLPDHGDGEQATLEHLAPLIVGGAAKLGAVTSMAHMDPPTPWITWAVSLWNAALNQNLLHPATAPAAIEAERRVIAWLAPLFGMNGGHMLPGSTIANLTALWAARDVAGIDTVAASGSAHISVRKAAHLLGLRFRELPAAADGTILPGPTSHLDGRTALVITAGHTSTGAIDPLALAGQAGWTHVDAAWAGPLRLSARHSALLDGIEAADSVAVSAHKWLFQPKESAMVLFRDHRTADAAISMGASYLAQPNVGLLGSHGAVAVPLLATLLAYGRTGLAERIDRCMADAQTLADWLNHRPDCALLATPSTGIVNWRPRSLGAADVLNRLPDGSTSLTTIGGEPWLRNVAANPAVDMGLLLQEVGRALIQA